MDNAGYTALARQSGLLREMQVVANNIANVSTTGFRQEGVVFTEFVNEADEAIGSLSMAHANARKTDLAQGALVQTGGTFDLAIEGKGYFLVETPEGNGLTRAGVFTPDANGELVTPSGNRLLDAGGAAVFVPPNARAISVAADGTIAADGRPIGQLGLFQPEDPSTLIRRDGVIFQAPGGVAPVEDGRILQGFVERSNVDPVGQITRMIEVQRAYELGQKLLDQEHERIRNVLQTIGR